MSQRTLPPVIAGLAEMAWAHGVASPGRVWQVACFAHHTMTAAPVPNGPPILIVDDDLEMRAMLRDFLAGSGFRTEEAGDTETLLELIPRVEPAAIILDHEMPGDWGLEVLPTLRQRYPGIPVILITAFGGPRTRETAERLGAAGYLDKPFRVSNLLGLVRTVLTPAVAHARDGEARTGDAPATAPTTGPHHDRPA